MLESKSRVGNHRAHCLLGAALSLASFGCGSHSNQLSNYQERFPSSLDVIPPDWQGKVFSLSQTYPKTSPMVEEQSKWRSIDFRTDGEAYLKEVLNYVLEGNREVDWVVQSNQTRRWYHAPWMHAGPDGREFINGLTRERSSRPGELHPNQKSTFQNWAVGIYNEAGGYTLGRVWNQVDKPDPTLARFPEGTVSAKLLYTEATDTEVPFMRGAPSVTANIFRSLDDQSRSPRTLRLLQVDIAVRDPRATETGWVFGTFVYQGDADGKTGWDRLKPLGVMWGNDPEQIQNPQQPISQSWINPNVTLPHLGFQGRLNGPVDNPRSSCLSCHATGQSPVVAKMAPSSNAPQEELQLYFRNLPAGTSFSEGGTSTDYSLQLSIGIENFTLSKQKK